MLTDSSSISALNERRRLAVKLRLQGRKLREISDLVDLSSPTIITAHKKFMQGGWDAVDVKPRGRPNGELSVTPEVLEQLRQTALSTPSADTPWNFGLLSDEAEKLGANISARTIGTYIENWGTGSANLFKRCKTTHPDWIKSAYKEVTDIARKQSGVIFWAGMSLFKDERGVHKVLYAHTTRGQYHWICSDKDNDTDALIDFFDRLNAICKQSSNKTKTIIIWKGTDPNSVQPLKRWLEQSGDVELIAHPESADAGDSFTADSSANPTDSKPTKYPDNVVHNSTNTDHGNKRTLTMPPQNSPLTHLQRLEAESIHIMREVIAEAENPVMLYSIGKDSAVMLHLAKKAFFPTKPPFPLLHIDTGWKFQAMYDFRDQVAKESGLRLLVHKNQDGVDKGVNPFTHGSALHTDIMKTEALKQALDKHEFDVAFGGARRDEEMSRAKERVLSFRTDQHRWDPKNQRPELWNLFNIKHKSGESIRAFPLSNWTELDIWHYIHVEQIPLVPLYFAAERPVVLRDENWIMVDDDRLQLNYGEVPVMKSIRFRTLGCYPLTGAIESTASTVGEVIEEMLLSNQSERQGRMIDHDNSASMEKKKQEGYF